MSSSNYGDKNLKIKIPIEIIPEEHGIKDEIKEIQKSERQLLGEGIAPRRRLFDEESLPGRGGLREYTPKLPETFGPPTEFRLGYKQPSTKGTARVPEGGEAPINRKDFKKSPKAVDDDLDETGIFEKVLGGPSKAREAISFLTNPMAGVTKALNIIGGGGAGIVVGGGTALAAIALWVVKEIVKKGGLGDKTFKNIIDTRVEIMRTREQQQRILVGFGPTAQLITTTTAGTTNPRDTYNSYTERNKEDSDFESDWAIRQDGGYP